VVVRLSGAEKPVDELALDTSENNRLSHPYVTRRKEAVMEVLYPRCCGLDVHKSSITACVLLAQSGKPLKHIRRLVAPPENSVTWLHGCLSSG